MAFGKSTQLIVRRGEELTEAQMNQAFAISESTPWYRALLQLIDESRQEFGRTAATRTDDNNALAMARDMGAYEALSGLLVDLEERRSKNAD